MTVIREFAPAKINLSLHVTGQQADGYHLLDSIVAFASVGDDIEIRPAPDVSLRLAGPESGELTPDDDNLVLRAARLFRAPVRAQITLIKALPVSSGIGGGSADAAATLRAIARCQGGGLPDPAAILGLGADVPVCLHGRAVRMQGVGDVLTDLPSPPSLGVLLVNPRVAVSTPAVFRRLRVKDNLPMPPTIPETWATEGLAWLNDQRNDLQTPAIEEAPIIADVLETLHATGAPLVRMSGSGATCFALFPSPADADAASVGVARSNPAWWVRAGRLS